MNDLPTMRDFEAHIHEQFVIELANQSLYPLELIQVSPLMPSRTPGVRTDPFQVMFHGPGPGYLPQQIHALHNDTLGDVKLFLVPVGQDQSGYLYQAVFN